MEKEKATHSSILAWRILWTKKPGGLQSMGWQSWTGLSDWPSLSLFKVHSKVIQLYMYIFQIIFYYKLLQDIEYSSLWR